MPLNRLILAVVLAAATWTAQAIPLSKKSLDGDGPWVVRVYDLNIEDFTRLRGQFDVWKSDSDDKYAVIAIKDKTELRLLQQLGFPVIVDPVMTERYHGPLSGGFTEKTIPNFPCYRTVEETLATAQAIATNNPTIAEIIDVGDSWDKTQNAANGFDLLVLKLTNQNIAGDKPKLHVLSAIHARELATAELVTRFAERLVNGYNEQDPDITWLIDHHEIHLLLQGNPDGRKEAEAGALWRKNANADYCQANPNSRGADLNRNFPFEWGGQGTSTNQCSDIFRGPSPMSEPETTSVVDYMRSIFPDQRGPNLNDPAPLDATGIHIDVHSFSQLVLFPYGFSTTSGPAPNQDQLSTLARRFSFFNAYRPQQAVQLGAAAGATDDFGYGDLGIASYTFELGTEFFQQCNFFENSIVEQNIGALMYAAKVVRTPYQTPSGPDVTSVIVSPNALLPGETANVMIQADGTRFGTVTDPTSPLEPARVIDDIEVFIDALPWQDPVSANATADDGAFDETVESASVTLNTTGLAAGRYPVFVQAVGQDNQAGAITAGVAFVLDPATAGRIFGQVVVQGTTTPVEDALIQAGPYQATSDASGNYSLNLPPDNYTVTVSADGFGSNSANITITNNEQEALNLNLLNRCSLFADDVENGTNGWTPDSPWAISSEQASSPTRSWHDSPGGNYGNNRNISLTSPTIDLSQASESELSFNHLCDTEAGFDFGIVEISVNGTDWTEVYRCDNQPGFQAQTVDISGLDGEANAQIRFRLQTDTAVTDNGWYVDDIDVTAVSNACQPDNPDFIFGNGFE